ncbi:hypothetical protein C8Q80DRAFT_4924 [Daedaleopsis nitida]|nr:hypothetical protein C8Q80DRAFT_4924 [Daedaleopsis nitida]
MLPHTNRTSRCAHTFFRLLPPEHQLRVVRVRAYPQPSWPSMSPHSDIACLAAIGPARTAAPTLHRAKVQFCPRIRRTDISSTSVSTWSRTCRWRTSARPTICSSRSIGNASSSPSAVTSVDTSAPPGELGMAQDGARDAERRDERVRSRNRQDIHDVLPGAISGVAFEERRDVVEADGAERREGAKRAVDSIPCVARDLELLLGRGADDNGGAVLDDLRYTGQVLVIQSSFGMRSRPEEGMKRACHGGSLSTPLYWRRRWTSLRLGRDQDKLPVAMFVFRAWKAASAASILIHRALSACDESRGVRSTRGRCVAIL